jgi:hypothetical protein
MLSASVHIKAKLLNLHGTAPHNASWRRYFWFNNGPVQLSRKRLVANYHTLDRISTQDIISYK